MTDGMNEDGKIPGTADDAGATDGTEALDALDALDASRASVAGIAWEALEARLAFALSDASAGTLPSYRRPWFASLIRQGREAEGTGRAALAAHCRDRLEREFAHFGIAPPPEASVVAVDPHVSPASPAPASAPGATPSGDAPEASAVGETGAGSRAQRGARSPGAPGSSGTPGAPGRSSDASRPPSPLEALALRRDAAARARLRELLERHAARLSPDEVAAYTNALAAKALETKTREAGTGAATGLVSVSELRRRLLDRLMRAARYRRQAVRLAAWAPAPPSGVAGPYNDHRALEELLHRITRAHPLAAEWAAEFFDIHADMRAVRQAYGTLLGSK